MRNSILLACAVLVMSACKPELPPDVLSERRMEQILHDYHFAQGMAENTPRSDDETVEMLLYDYQEAVFRKYGITREEFEHSMYFYCSDMDRMTRIYKNVTQRLEREADALGIQASEVTRDAYANLTVYGDTANVWADRDLITLKPRVLENFYTWHIDADSTWHSGDDLLWRFQMMQLAQGTLSAMEVDLVVVYDNDSVRSSIAHVTSNPLVELRIQTPNGWMPREVEGHVFLTVDEENHDYRLMLLHHPVLARMHKPDGGMKAAADSLAVDSLLADSLMADSLADGSIEERRLSPAEFRDRQEVERTIEVIKEQPFDPRGQKRGFPQRRRRRR